MAFNKRDTPAGLYDKLYQADKKAADAKKADELPANPPPKKQNPLWKNTFNNGEETKK